MINRSTRVKISDPSTTGAARRKAVEFSQQLGFDETEVGRVSLVATEAATNLIKHAIQGAVYIRTLAEGEGRGLEILTIDKGPGMPNVAKCLSDGYSTAGSSGTGLGAMERLADLFDVYSMPGQGTVLVAQLWKGKSRKPGAMTLGAVCVPLDDGDRCGDAWTSHCDGERAQFMVADGLGHGAGAAEAADEAVRVFHRSPGRRPAEIVRDLHGPLRATRGASLAIAEIHFTANAVRYAGVGNIAGTILDSELTHSMVSHNGIVGHEMRSVVEFNYPWNPGRTMVLHSDGLQTRWKLDVYPGLLARHPALIAGVLFRDFYRGRDDATVLVVRDGRAPR